jgi:hypothetical protein
VKDIGWHDWHLIMIVELKAQNTSNQTMTVQSIALNVYTKSGGSKILIGNISMFNNPIVLKENSETIIELDAILQTIAAVTDLITAFSTGNFTQTIILDGWANVDNQQIPINEEIKVP